MYLQRSWSNTSRAHTCVEERETLRTTSPRGRRRPPRSRSEFPTYQTAQATAGRQEQRVDGGGGGVMPSSPASGQLSSSVPTSSVNGNAAIYSTDGVRRRQLRRRPRHAERQLCKHRHEDERREPTDASDGAGVAGLARRVHERLRAVKARARRALRARAAPLQDGCSSALPSTCMCCMAVQRDQRLRIESQAVLRVPNRSAKLMAATARLPSRHISSQSGGTDEPYRPKRSAAGASSAAALPKQSERARVMRRRPQIGPIVVLPSWCTASTDTTV